jgi:hypothetical protein
VIKLIQCKAHGRRSGPLPNYARRSLNGNLWNKGRDECSLTSGEEVKPPSHLRLDIGDKWGGGTELLGPAVKDLRKIVVEPV